MRLLVVVVGRARGPVGDAVAEYERRAQRYWKLEVLETKAGAGGGGASAQEVRAAEGERILSSIPSELEVIALTRAGEGMASTELSGYLQERMVRSSPGVAFVVGGAYGLDDAVTSRARIRLSLSEMTLPHEIARLLLAEQLYRAGTILRGEPYHKG